MASDAEVSWEMLTIIQKLVILVESVLATKYTNEFRLFIKVSSGFSKKLTTKLNLTLVCGLFPLRIT